MSKNRRQWPEKRRKTQAVNCRKTKPERFATGPKTAAGKAAIAQNALKSGLHTAEIIALRAALSRHKRFLKLIAESDFRGHASKIVTTRPRRAQRSEHNQAEGRKKP